MRFYGFPKINLFNSYLHSTSNLVNSFSSILTSNFSKMKNYSLTKLNNFNVRLPRMSLKRKDKILTPRTRHSYHTSMSNKTKDFLHKLVNKKSPPVDMTQYGFVSDRNDHPKSTVINPLKAQFNKLIGRPTERIIIPRVRAPAMSGGLKNSSRRRSGFGAGGNTKSYSGGPGGNKTTMSIQASPLFKKTKKISG